ncbi:MAG: hypothetical protein L0Y54_21365 [Sporichthyaceae bacterium]|nr:hypothetical protein [Sporichthyaceae bacterium]
MADPSNRSEYDKLLAEVDGALSGKPATTPERRPARADRGELDTGSAPSLRARLMSRIRVSFIAAAVAAGLVWLLFAILPVLASWSGAAGAFIGTFVAVLVLRRR